MNRNNMTWEEFASGVRKHQRGFMGEPMEVRPGRGEFHENPSACICENSEAKAEADSNPRKFGFGKSATNTDVAESVDDQNNDNEQEWSDQEEEDDMSGSQGTSQFDGTSNDYDGATSEEPELEELLSD